MASISSPLLTTFEHDVNVSASDKASCLKLLGIVVKNLSDPEKVQEEKFRLLRLNNPKIQVLVRHSIIVSYLEQVIGFKRQVIKEDNSDVTVLRMDHIPAQTSMFAEWGNVTKALERVNLTLPPPPQQPSSNPKVLSIKHSTSSMSIDSTSASIQSGISTATSTSLSDGQQQQQQPVGVVLTEKQKARILLEQKQAMEKEQERKERKRTSAQIKADKYVRENDPNWKPSVSAAANKNGSSMQTFRDKFGET